MKNKFQILLISAAFITGCSVNNQPDLFNNLNKYNLNMPNNTTYNSGNEIILNKNKKYKKTQLHKKVPFEEPKYTYKVYKNFQKNKLTKKTYTLSVTNIPIVDFIKLIYGQILHKNYIISDNISKSTKKITLNITTPVSKEVFLQTVKNILNSNKIVINQQGDIYYFKIGNPKNLKKFSNIIIYGREIPKQLSQNLKITMIVPLYYINYYDIQTFINNFYLSPKGSSYYLRSKSVVIFTDYVSNLKKILNFINLMDVPTLKEKHIKLVKFNFINVNKFITRMNSVLPSLGIKISHKLNGLGILMTPIPELNSLLIISDKQSWINTVMFWKQKLDQINLNSEQPQIFIYHAKNRTTSELATLIKSLFSKTLNKKNKNFVLNIINDKDRNNLIIYTTPKIYNQIYQLLPKLDTLPKEVLIQVTIAEITLKNSLQYGLEWFLKNNHGFSKSLGTLGNLGLGGGGIVGSIINSDKTINILFSALAQKNLIHILSSPKLIVVNNKSASINVGTQVPVLTSSIKSTNTATTTTQVSQSVQYRNTGIILNVTPVIHSNGTLTLKISQTVSDPQPNNTSSISSPIILNRSLNTQVVLKSNQTLLLGGLIKQNTGTTINKVPVLGDIPMLKYLFSAKSKSTEKTELIIMVKPIIISNTNEANDVLNKFKSILINNKL